MTNNQIPALPMAVHSELLDYQVAKRLEVSYQVMLQRKVNAGIRANACRSYYKGEQVHCIDITLLPVGFDS